MSRALTLSILTLAAILAACSACDEPVSEPPSEVGPGDEAAVLRARMVGLIEADIPGLDVRVLAALRKVPRHRFVPGAPVINVQDSPSLSL